MNAAEQPYTGITHCSAPVNRNGWRVASPDTHQQAGWRDSESTRNFYDIEQAEVSLPALDTPDVRPVKIGLFRKPLLR